MQHVVELHCRYCHPSDLVKNGHSETGAQRYRCKTCGRTFQVDYQYNAWKPGTKAQIDAMTLNSSGVRDIGRTLEISPNTSAVSRRYVAHLKKTPASGL